jgi:hypothetical protein
VEAVLVVAGVSDKRIHQRLMVEQRREERRKNRR